MKAWKRIKFRKKPWTKVIPLGDTVTPRAKVVRMPPNKSGRKAMPLRDARDVGKSDQQMIVQYGLDHHIMQAERIWDKFGGPRRLMDALARVGRPRNPASIYKWAYPMPKGRGGLIPTSAWRDILTAARHEGISLTNEDAATTMLDIKASGVTFKKRRHGNSKLVKQQKEHDRYDE